MIVNVDVEKNSTGYGFEFQESDSGLLKIAQVTSNAEVREGDTLLSISGLRGAPAVQIVVGRQTLDSVPVGESFRLAVGRTPSADDLSNYSGPTKEQLRQKVWNYLEENDLADFPRPCHHRIPNFKGSKGACDRLLALDAFRDAVTVKINPDKPQQQARILTLQQRKKLLVPTPRLRSGLFNHIQPPEGCTTQVLKQCSTAQGVKDFGVAIPLEAKMTVDLVVIGAVVVSQKGYRIGKGEGFADMEWAMMATMGAVGPATTVVSVVHDAQVMDIPDEIIDSHDLTVDVILTPSRVIHCDRHLPRPMSLIWEKLTLQRVREIPILAKMMEMEKEKGKEVVLKEEGGRGKKGVRGFARVQRGYSNNNGDDRRCYNCNELGHMSRDCLEIGQADSAIGKERGKSERRGSRGGRVTLSSTIRGAGREVRNLSRGMGGRLGGGSGDERRCYNCNEKGHLSCDCAEAPQNDFENATRSVEGRGDLNRTTINYNSMGRGVRNQSRGFGRGNSDNRQCYQCKGYGHIARDCEGIGSNN